MGRIVPRLLWRRLRGKSGTSSQFLFFTHSPARLLMEEDLLGNNYSTAADDDPVQQSSSG